MVKWRWKGSSQLSRTDCLLDKEVIPGLQREVFIWNPERKKLSHYPELKDELIGWGGLGAWTTSLESESLSH
ncbi:hypothetical protein CK820_G0002172 [Pan troglodytes]|uniref:Uncharacterized protein n=1 Tax=Pan troglodytes TaxID=9598 RepID=A0A2J8PNB4_PANTR|nr:hypothetical protein CK820_G0002172 [Pan troglodytes]